MRAVFIIVAAVAVNLALGAIWALGLLGYLVAFVAAIVMVVSLYDFGMATAGHYRACDARPAAWWATVSGAVLAVVVTVWF